MNDEIHNQGFNNLVVLAERVLDQLGYLHGIRKLWIRLLLD